MSRELGNKSGALVCLTGASGSGKTTIAAHIAERMVSHVKVVHFDSIGVPPRDEMVRDYGSGENWQRQMTFDWLERIASQLSVGEKVLFEGQSRIAFITEGIAAAGVEGADIILIDCDDDLRMKRLSERENKSGFNDPHMLPWAQFLRKEAIAGGHTIIDTTAISVSYAANLILSRFQEY